MQPNENKPASKPSPSHAVRRVHRFNFGGPGERFDYLATGSKEDCEALVSILSLYRTIYGASPEHGEVGEPFEEVTDAATVPEWAFRIIRKRSAKTMTERNLASLKDSPYASQFVGKLTMAA
jgi:hypothetical protein